MSETRKWLVFAGILVGMTAATIEKSIVATALPTITEEIGGLTLYSWVFGAYMLASTITIPLFSKLADLKGRRPLYVGGMIIFLTGTFLAATATSMTQLILYRLIQGTGAGAVAPAALAAIGDIFPHKTRGRAFGISSVRSRGRAPAGRVDRGQRGTGSGLTRYFPLPAGNLRHRTTPLHFLGPIIRITRTRHVNHSLV